MKLAIICVTKKAVERAILTKVALRESIDEIDIYVIEKYNTKDTIPMRNGFKNTVKEIFNSYSTHLFIMASGIVVRTIAPLIVSKDVDPSVLIMDERGNFVTSLLSGHLGGGNEMTEMVSEAISAIPVISTASDVSGKLAVDTLAMKIGAELESLESAKVVTSLMVAGERVEIKIPNSMVGENPSGVVVVSNKKVIEVSQVIPKNIVVGIGCRRDTPVSLIESVMKDAFEEVGVDIRAIRTMTSVDIKADEVGIIELAKRYKKELIIIERAQIRKIEGEFTTSEFVRKTIGVGAVSGPCAKLASKREGRFLVEKHAREGVTISLYEEKTEVYSYRDTKKS